MKCLIFENIVYSVERNAKSYDLKRIQADGERLIFVQQLTDKDRFHLKNLLIDMQEGEVITGEMMSHSEHTLPSVIWMLLARYHKKCI